jgi:trigger factor
MKITELGNTNTVAKYIIIAETEELDSYKTLAAKHLSANVSVPGFRKSKAPTDMVLKYADPSKVQEEFINHGINDLYIRSQSIQKLKTIGDPKISIKKFVPYTTLEIEVEVPIIATIKLADYKNLKINKIKVEVTKEEIDKNLAELQKRASTFKAVDRAAKNGDMVNIDFEGLDFKTKEKLPQATADAYQLVLGDNTFIEGFEENLIGLKKSQKKDFNLIFPKNYPDKSFASRKVTFKVTLNDVSEVELPKLDDQFAATVGPFKTIKELKDEIQKQLRAELERQATIDQENAILNEIAEKSEIELAEAVIEQEASAMIENRKKEALGRGQTWKEFLSSRGQTEEEYKKENDAAAVIRVKGGIAIGEIATLENIVISDTDIDANIASLKSQYFDPEMQAQLEDPNNRREIAMRIITEKVLDAVRSYQK